jgi:hypothetical protein
METDSGSDATGQGFVTIRSFLSRSEAQIAKAALEAFGIECIINFDDCGGQRPHLVLGAGIRLVVAAENAGRAEEVLANRADE